MGAFEPSSNFLGKTFGRLTVIEDFGCDIQNSMRKVAAICECGNITECYLNHLRRGTTQSCGCLRRERHLASITKHKLCRHPLYRCWYDMIDRCYRQKNKSYNNYGGRGISVCQKWRKSFVAFYDWAIENGWKKTLQLDRKNNSLNYSPSNCRFITAARNNRNKRTNVFLEYDGKKMILPDWATYLGISIWTIRNRLEKGWPIKDVLSRKKYFLGSRKFIATQ